MSKLSQVFNTKYGTPEERLERRRKRDLTRPGAYGVDWSKVPDMGELRKMDDEDLKAVLSPHVPSQIEAVDTDKASAFRGYHEVQGLGDFGGLSDSDTPQGLRDLNFEPDQIDELAKRLKCVPTARRPRDRIREPIPEVVLHDRSDYRLPSPPLGRIYQSDAERAQADVDLGRETQRLRNFKLKAGHSAAAYVGDFPDQMVDEWDYNPALPRRSSRIFRCIGDSGSILLQWGDRVFMGERSPDEFEAEMRRRKSQHAAYYPADQFEVRSEANRETQPYRYAYPRSFELERRRPPRPLLPVQFQQAEETFWEKVGKVMALLILFALSFGMAYAALDIVLPRLLSRRWLWETFLP